jgi:asparagine synthase (glutamine-hydrolysing)
MQNQLLKDSDYMSMWHSIEIRVPLLDKELIELAYQISPEIKAFEGQKKYLLIHTLGSLLPRSIWDRPKMGFTFPFQRWLGGEARCERREARKDIAYAVGKFERGEYTWSRYWATRMIK